MKTLPWIFLGVFFFYISASPVAANNEESGGVVSKTFSVNKGGKLEISTEGGDILIKPWEKNEVFVKVEGIDEEDVDRVKMTQTGNTITVRYRAKWGWLGSRVRHARFDVNVPSQFNVELETSGGDIEIMNGLNGTLKGETSGGDIRLGDVTGMVDMKTSGGDVRTTRIHGNGILKTSGGDIQVGSVSGDLEALTAGGDIKIERVGKMLLAKTAGGDIMSGDVGGEAKVSTAGGDVKVGKVSGGASLSTAGGDIELGGGSGLVTSKTAGGDIRLENISGSIEAKTAGGDVIAELHPGGKGKSKLSSAGGDVKLYLPEHAKATIDARIRVHGWWGSHGDEYEIQSDFKSETHEKDEAENEIRATYILNGGGEVISLTTTNANIEIRKLKK